MTFDLFHQPVYRNIDFTIEADYTGVFPQYYVYDSRNGSLVGITNCTNFMGVCRIIMNEYRSRMGLPAYDWSNNEIRNDNNGEKDFYENT